jgi:hypothetical protein
MSYSKINTLMAQMALCKIARNIDPPASSIEAFDPVRFSALLWGLPGSNPLADARVRDAFASVKRGESARDAGDLPLIGVEVGGNRLGREERPAATGALGELFKAALGRATYTN